MKAAKRSRLEKAGWRIGDAADFLQLSADESAIVEMKLSLADQIKLHRKRLGMTQAELARLLGSSQSRVAKMEVGEGSVSMDLLVRALLAMGVPSSSVGKYIGGGKKVAPRFPRKRSSVKSA